MTDSNGYVAAVHLRAFGSVTVSLAIYARVVATAADFHNSGYSFNIQPPGGGDRPAWMQTAMRADYIAGKYQQPPYYLSPPPSPIPGVAGTSRHGFALAIDVTTNAPVAVRNSIMARNGWHLWSSSDPNHFEPNGLDVLKAPPESAFAGGGSTPLEGDLSMADAASLENLLLMSGTPYGYPQRTNQIVQDLWNRFFVMDANGNPLYDRWQWMNNTVVPGLTAAIQALGGGSQVDIEQLLKESEARQEAAGQEQLHVFGTALMADLVTTIDGLGGGASDTTLSKQDVIDALGTFFEQKFSATPAPTTTPAQS